MLCIPDKNSSPEIEVFDQKSGQAFWISIYTRQTRIILFSHSISGSLEHLLTVVLLYLTTVTNKLLVFHTYSLFQVCLWLEQDIMELKMAKLVSWNIDKKTNSPHCLFINVFAIYKRCVGNNYHTNKPNFIGPCKVYPCKNCNYALLPLFQISMSRYIPVRTTMDSEDHYHSPYDTHELDSDQHYEAPTCLKRNPSGSLFIPSGEDGQCDHREGSSFESQSRELIW